MRGARGGGNHEHDARGFGHGLDELLRVLGVHVHHGHLHVSLGQTARDGLRQSVAEPVVARVEDRGRSLGLLESVLAPFLVPADQFLDVELEQRAVAVADAGKVVVQRVGAVALALAERGEHRPRVGLHEALVVEPVVGKHRLEVGVEHVLGAVVRAKRVARVHELGGGIEREHGIRPVEVGRHDKPKLVAAAEVHDVAALDRPRLERLLHEILQELDANLAADDRGVGGELQDGADETAVVGLGVGAHDVVDGRRIDDALEGVDVQLLEFGVRRVDEGSLGRALDDVGVVGGAQVEAELDVESVAVPVERADARGVRADLGDLRLQALGALEHLDLAVLDLRRGGAGGLGDRRADGRRARGGDATGHPRTRDQRRRVGGHRAGREGSGGGHLAACEQRQRRNVTNGRRSGGLERARGVLALGRGLARVGSWPTSVP